MIHVLHVVTCLRLGGAERVLADIVAETDRSRFRHTICYLHPPHDLRDELRASGCELLCLNAPERHGWGAAAGKLRALVRQLKPDVVHSATFAANITARLAVGRSRVPQLSWLVSMEYHPPSVRAAGWSMWKNRLYRTLDRATARYARSSFIACAQAVRRSAIEQLGIKPANISVIYNPVRLEALLPEAGETAALRRELRLPDDAFVYFNVGRMDAPKAQGLLLKAFAQVAAEQPDAYLIILGRGALEKELPEQAWALGIGDRVRFVARAPRIAPFLALANVFVFPSLLEGLPVALLEAMCAGVPAIVSDIPPHVEVVESAVTGLFAPAGSDRAIAERLRQLYADPVLRRAIGVAAREAARARFSTAAIVPQWEATFARHARRPA